MYRRILVPLEHSGTDACIVEHVRGLARHCGASLVLIHVADGWVAQHHGQLELRESDEMRRDREYLDRQGELLRGDGFEVDAVLASGDPAREIAAAALREQCDLIAMGTHGHKLLADLVYGSVASEVRHIATVPVLLVRDLARAGGARQAPA
ncbi:MAG: universal stress protein [Gemmatimonadetes bacterium]|nr:universal stress protein [Gemmatimonadota bacterium]